MKNSMVCIFALTIACSALSGCGGGESETKQEPRNVRRVTAYIEPKSETDTYGTAIFINEKDGVALQVSLETTPTGTDEVLIHEIGDCSAPDASSAGGPWRTEDLYRVGEITIGKDGKGALSYDSTLWSMGTGEPNDILGKAVVIVSEGRRIGCGVIPEQ